MTALCPQRFFLWLKSLSVTYFKYRHAIFSIDGVGQGVRGIRVKSFTLAIDSTESRRKSHGVWSVELKVFLRKLNVLALLSNHPTTSIQVLVKEVVRYVQ